MPVELSTPQFQADIHKDPSLRSLSKLRVALVHYWLIGRSGGEKVLESLAELFPQADIFTLVLDRSVLGPSLRGRQIYTSMLQKIPGVTRFHRHSLFLQPFALENFDLSGYDLVISSESGPAKGVLTSPSTCHICYCHSPMRYIWDMSAAYRKGMGPVVGSIFNLSAHYMRLWDLASASRVDHFVANSRFVAERIRKFYRRESTVIHPPVEIPAAEPNETHDDYYLMVGRLVSYKRVDLAIEACNRLQRRLRIVGEGPEYRKLKRIAGPTIQFLGAASDSDLQEQYRECRAFLLPGEEDFGIAPLEAQGYGRAVIAYGSGGALETVRGIRQRGPIPENPTGVFFEEQSVDGMMAGILRYEAIEDRFVPQLIRKHSLTFDKSHFDQKMADFVSLAMEPSAREASCAD